MDKKIAIIGGGIAGVTIAWQAHYAGFEVHLFDEKYEESPSRVAAGIINPLSFNRKKPMWNAEKFTAAAWALFNGFNAPFVYPNEMIVRLANAKVQNDWTTSVANEQGWINWGKDNSEISIKGSGRIDTNQYINHFPLTKFELINEKVNAAQLAQSNYEKVVLATGAISNEILGSAYRTDIFRPVLGDVLEVELEKSYQFIHLEGLFIIPITLNRYVLGSTYIHEFTSTNPTPERANVLIEKAKLQGVKIVKVLKHKAAVRPAVYDRMPLVGNVRNNIEVFAGMGSRGLFHAPLLAQQLVNQWLGKEEINKMVDIKRCLAK